LSSEALWTLQATKALANGGELMSEPMIATALLDRLLHHAQTVNIRGNSCRLKDRAKTDVAIAQLTDIPAQDSSVQDRPAFHVSGDWINFCLAFPSLLIRR
jgi:hypothetical protein